MSFQKHRASSYGKSGEAPFDFHKPSCLNDVTSLFSKNRLISRRLTAASTILIFSLRSVSVDVESSGI